MKKAVYLTLIVSLFSLHSAFAANEKSEPSLVPADSLEEMMDEGVMDSGADTVADFDDHDGGHHRHVVCEARNRRGRIFRAWGERPREVQFRAMRECERVSRHCFPLGCHRG